MEVMMLWHFLVAEQLCELELAYSRFYAARSIQVFWKVTPQVSAFQRHDKTSQRWYNCMIIRSIRLPLPMPKCW